MHSRALIDRPVLTLAHERLHAFLGEWAGEERLSDSRWAKAGTARSLVSAKLDLDGFVVDQQSRQERADGEVFLSRGLFGYDAEDGLYKLWWFDSLGFMPPSPASGPWKDGALTLLRTSLRGAARHTYRFEGADRYTMRIEYSWTGGDDWSEILTGVYIRR